VPISGPVVVFDDDHYYLGGVIAEKLRAAGSDVTLVTPESQVSSWTWATLEQFRIQAQIMNSGIDVITSKNLVAVNKKSVELACVYTGERSILDAGSVVMVTARWPEDSLFLELDGDAQKLADAGIHKLDCIGDCHAPATIANAVYAGHRYARECDEPESEEIPFRRELVEIL
jgi:dimethylamine/trimethylamine dehydrogenase